MSKILIADDDPLVVDSLRQVIERMNHEASSAGTVAAALEAEEGSPKMWLPGNPPGADRPVRASGGRVAR
jgi:DNA-binding NtrC family response regulator